MTTVYGTTLSGLDEPSLATGVESLVAHLRGALPEGGRVAVLPDAHYPYHPSTGMVTNPAVVDALATALVDGGAEPPIEVVVPRRGSLDPSTVATYLGYDERASDGPLAVTPIDASPGRDGHAGAPAVLTDRTVLVVPSVRVGHDVAFAGALATVTRAVGGDPGEAEDVREALRAVEPVGALADATYVFAGEPYRASTLLLSSEIGAVDRVVATLLSLGDVEPLASSSQSDASVEVRDVDVDRLRAAIPDGEPIREDEPGRLVRAGYRLYTALSGDAYPPQFRGRG